MALPEIDLYSENKLSSKRNIMTFLVIGILMLAIPFGVSLTMREQTLKSKAAGDEITFSGSGVRQDAQGNWFTTDPSVQVVLKSPLGGPVGPTATPTTPPRATNTPTPSGRPTPTTTPPAQACNVKNWSFSNNSPAPNTLIKATVTGVSDPGGWMNVVYKKETDSSWVTPYITVTAGPTFSFDVNSGSSGLHTVTLGTSNGTYTCSPTGKFTTL